MRRESAAEGQHEQLAAAALIAAQSIPEAGNGNDSQRAAAAEVRDVNYSSTRIKTQFRKRVGPNTGNTKPLRAAPPPIPKLAKAGGKTKRKPQSKAVHPQEQAARDGVDGDDSPAISSGWRTREQHQQQQQREAETVVQQVHPCNNVSGIIRSLYHSIQVQCWSWILSMGILAGASTKTRARARARARTRVSARTRDRTSTDAGSKRRA